MTGEKDSSSSPSRDELDRLIADAAGLLPEQAPLHAFVHHNTLHHWEDLPFDSAIEASSRVLGTEGYQTEARFRAHLEMGRIQDRDLVAVCKVPETLPVPLFEGGPTRSEFELFRLRHLFEVPSESTIDWHLHEQKAAVRLHPEVAPERRHRILASGDGEREVLARLWASLEAVAPSRAGERPGPRWRDRLLAACCEDSDLRVHPILIRLASAFLDQGIAYWTLPQRESGLLSCFRRLYGQPGGISLGWRKGLARALREQEEADWSAHETIAWALKQGGVDTADRARFIEATLLSLRGWAGMVHHLEQRPDRAPVAAPPARLADYLAVQLVLDLFAARSLVRVRFGAGETLARWMGVSDPSEGKRQPDRSQVYEAYLLAQFSELPLARFEDHGIAAAWMAAVSDFDAIRRRQRLHLAYERRHRVEVLDALEDGRGRSFVAAEAPRFQAMFCIDDREESTRRHLEEIEPRVETFGYAGFFGVAMYYEGLDDIRSRPLCPVVVSPSHLVRETAAESARATYQGMRRRRARARNATRIGMSTLLRGGVLAPIFGPLSIIPLVLHTLFPRVAHRVGHWLEDLGYPRPPTRLSIEESETESIEDVVRVGYRVDEMAEIVAAALRTMGLDPSRSPLVVVVGHGSSSLNNPHEAAHDCGATGGGRGGPNARAFAAMANHPPVRDALKQEGLEIPASTWFVGAYHNTCDDSIEFYDSDLVPADGHAALALARVRLAEACRAEARERCRRFETAPLGLSLEAALADAQEHAVDLAQPRPEYGHATNSICIVGRRSITRGLFLDRRAFLVSYDPTTDPEGDLLAPLLLSVGPVGAGINLEYYFSFVDPLGFGSGTKLPHNITGLLGVMDGHASDLRTGLPWQMVEIHEPVRLLIIVDANRTVLERVLAANPGLAALVTRGWVQLVSREPEDGALSVFEGGAFQPYARDAAATPRFACSFDYFGQRREALPPAWLDFRGAA